MIGHPKIANKRIKGVMLKLCPCLGQSFFSIKILNSIPIMRYEMIAKTVITILDLS